MGTRADRLLCCAVAYYEYKDDDTESTTILPSKFNDERNAIDAMMRTLWFEANRSMQGTIAQPDDAYLHAVDIESSEPGIITSHAKAEVHRRKLPVPKVIYEKATKKKVCVENIYPPKGREEALIEAVEREKKAFKAVQREANREIKAEERSLERLEKREEKKRQREAETPEEREARLEEQRMKRNEKKREKMEEEAARALAQPEEEEEILNHEGPDEDIVGAAEPDLEEENADDPLAVVVNLDEALETDATIEVNADRLIPPRVKARNSKMKFYPSPIPFDRHLSALECSGLNETIRDAVLEGKVSSNLRIIHGPPGTGKTRHLARMINDFGNARILVCAPTNVGTANLYARVTEHCEDASLLMPMSRIPADTAVMSQSPYSRVVCSTISGRAGHVLNDEEFGVVMVDEAAQCMEAWIWCLLRPEVHTLIMAGDVHQLPALTSEEGGKRRYDRSLMERLMDLKYPAEFLGTQHRMHSEIVQFPNALFYNGRLRTEYVGHETFTGRPYEVINIEGECRTVGTSYCNQSEIDCCMKLQEELSTLLTRVVIISPYQAQTRALLAAGAKNVHTIDSFQGQEADAIIVSVVRHEDLGFWSDYRRLNVALTRARHCLRVVGASRLWTGMLGKLANDAKTRNILVK
tara:strand:+ start:168 stop:2087 length:1920 start_codon:yes stop_codon:yes gene_type:complete